MDIQRKRVAFSDLTDVERFNIELEFIQNLANPAYLHYLAQNRYFEDERFLNFLRYLRYWKQPSYLRHIMFPHCLAMLDRLIEDELFRQELKVVQFQDFIHQQQYKHWELLFKQPPGASEDGADQADVGAEGKEAQDAKS